MLRIQVLLFCCNAKSYFEGSISRRAAPSSNQNNLTTSSKSVWAACIYIHLHRLSIFLLCVEGGWGCIYSRCVPIYPVAHLSTVVLVFNQAKLFSFSTCLVLLQQGIDGSTSKHLLISKPQSTIAAFERNIPNYSIYFQDNTEIPIYNVESCIKCHFTPQ